MQLGGLVTGLCRATARWTRPRKELAYNAALGVAMLALTADFLRRRWIVLDIIAQKANLSALLSTNWQSIIVMVVNSQASSMLTKMALVDMLLVGARAPCAQRPALV